MKVSHSSLSEQYYCWNIYNSTSDTRATRVISLNLRNFFSICEKTSLGLVEEKVKVAEGERTCKLAEDSLEPICADSSHKSDIGPRVGREVNNVVRYSRLWKSVKRSCWRRISRRERNIYLLRDIRGVNFSPRFRLCARVLDKFCTIRRKLYIDDFYTYSCNNICS